MARLFWTINLFLLLLNLTGAEVQVFMTNEEADNILIRQKRENSLFEEMKEGNLERECMEERCSYEEAREVFEDYPQTDEFWSKYVDGDQCESNPCRNSGLCRDGVNRYECKCLHGYKGINCEIDVPKLCNLDNGGCHHYCRVQRDRVRCSCVGGYELGADDKMCIPRVSNPCGVIESQRTRGFNLHSDPETINNTATNLTDDQPSDTGVNDPNKASMRIVGGQDCPLGQCPWQVLLIDENKDGFCGGTILTELFVLTAAHCLNQTRTITVVAGEFDVSKEEFSEQRQDVEAVVPHPSFYRRTYDNDIAVLMLNRPLQLNRNVVPICLPHRDFAEKVLMNMPHALVSGWGRVHENGMPSIKLQRLTVPYIDRAKCIESSRFPLSQNMFCAGYDDESKDACQGDSGGPHVTEHKSTWFLTGVVSWGEGCAQKGKYGIYTKTSKYIKWVKKVIEAMNSHRNTSSNT
ncbi:coagulation factor X-like [Heptranchias perlo]|uniref:coagulation factor X-like n=1 Tax=Heptranchias perlo TaxID=212740 RepID=UPI00355A947B